MLLSAKLVSIMKDCAYIQKQGSNDYHHYRYATAADVMEKINAALVKHQVASVVMPELLELREITNAKGNSERLATVKTTVSFVDSESGESLQFIGLGSGQDTGDKAVMKAQTASLKYAYLMTLAIATGDDPESDSAVDERMQHKNASSSSISTPVPEHHRAYEYLQDWVAANERRFTIDGNPSAGWYEGTELYFLPASFNTVLAEGNFHPGRIRRDFAQEGLIRRGQSELTITKINPHTSRTTRVLHLPGFLSAPNDAVMFEHAEIVRQPLLVDVENQESRIPPLDSTNDPLMN